MRRAARLSTRSALALATAAPWLVAPAAAPWLVAPAAAGDQSLSMTLTERLFADSNVQLEEGDGFSFGALTSLGVSYGNRLPTSALSLSTGFSYNFFSNEANDNLDGLFPRLSGSYVVNRPSRSFRVNFSGSVTPVDFFTTTGILLVPEEPDDRTGNEDDDDDPDEPDTPVDEDGDGIPDDQAGDDDDPDDGSDDGGDAPDPVVVASTEQNEGLRVSLSTGVGYNERINSIESYSLSASASRVEFFNDNGEFTPSSTFGFGAGYNRQFTNKITGGGSLSGSYFQADDETNRQSISVSAGPSLSWRRTPIESYSFSLGPAYTVTTFDTQVAGGGRISEREESLSLRGSAGITYSPAGGSYTASITQGVTPADEGVLVNQTSLNLGVTQRVSATSTASAGLSSTFRTALQDSEAGDFEDDVFSTARAGFSQTINRRSSGSVSTFAQIDDDGGFEEVTTGVSVGYSHRLTERVTANLSYTFRLERTQNEDLTSHRVGLTFSRGFTIIP